MHSYRKLHSHYIIITHHIHLDPEGEEGDLWGMAPENKFVSHDIPLVAGGQHQALSHFIGKTKGGDTDRISSSSDASTQMVWPFTYIEAGINMALDELAADFGDDEALPVCI